MCGSAVFLLLLWVLNAIVTDIVLIEQRKLHYFAGDYDAFKKRHASFVAEQRRKAHAEHKELHKLQASLAKGDAAAATKSARKQAKERAREVNAQLKQLRGTFEVGVGEA